MSRSMRAEQSELSPYNHYLQQFLTFLKQERGSPTPPLSTANVR